MTINDSAKGFTKTHDGTTTILIYQDNSILHIMMYRKKIRAFDWLKMRAFSCNTSAKF